LPQLAKGVKVSHQRGWLGISMGEIDSSITEYLGIKPDTEGVIVAEVVPNSPAAKAGLKSYDIITTFGGKPVKNPQDLAVAVKRAEPGKKYGVDIIRKGKSLKLDVVLSTEKEENYASSAGSGSDGSSSVSLYGIYADDLDRETIKKYRLQGVTPYGGVLVVQVESDSPAAKANIKVGDIILEVNQQQIKNTRDFSKALNRKVNLLKIKRGDHTAVIVLK
ncbi:MAG: PDZ domain-containing protein, partial [Oligoflexia bacterium]|nr:PDZ domain-containing protein [Oligoflexia bacterium]